MSKKRSRHNDGDRDENDESKNKNRTQITVAFISAIAAIIAASISFSAQIKAAIIGSEGNRNSLSPTVLLGSTSVDNASIASSASTCAYPPRYGFECGQSGWDKTSYFRNQAIQAVTTIQFNNRGGIP